MQPMLKTIDVFIGLSLVMLLLSMIVTVMTQAITSLLNSRGKNLLSGVADMLEQIQPGIDRQIAEDIARAALTHPLVSGPNGSLGSVIHREELTKLLLELGTDQGKQKLRAAAKQALQTALVENGLCQPGTPDDISSQIRDKLENIRAAALQLELAHPELGNAARSRIAFLQHANSQFLAKINVWFDQTMDRASERFTAHARYVTFFAGLALALVLQLDTATLVSRLSADDSLRQSLLDIATKQTSAPPPPSSAPSQTDAASPAAPQPGVTVGGPGQAAAPAADSQQVAPPVPIAQANSPAPDSQKQIQPKSEQNAASGTDARSLKEKLQLKPSDFDNVRDLMLNNVIGIPQSLTDWTNRWNRDNWLMKAVGILLTSLLLSLGAPFWYGALQNLLRLRSTLAAKDDQQRKERQVTGEAPPASDASEGVVLTDERGDLAAVA